MSVEQHTILVVEDERPLRRVLQDKLAREGFMVKTASDGREGITVALEALPDLFVLDLLMPHVDGHKMMVELVSQKPEIEQIPAIVLSNVSLSEIEAEKVIPNKDKWYLVKSDWPLDDIVAKIREILLHTNVHGGAFPKPS